jgi:AmmeMemoRadiSam system protein A
MTNEQLTHEERSYLLNLARKALEDGVFGRPVHLPDLGSIPINLRAKGASFVTLRKKGQLRGCIGALEPKQPLVEDVCDHAVAAATQDYRFPQVTPDELADISIEISRLTIPRQIEFQDPDDLINKLRPGIDGVVLRDGINRATFLPQVWEKIPCTEDFLGHLCNKMGLPSDAWRKRRLNVQIYQVEEFNE